MDTQKVPSKAESLRHYNNQENEQCPDLGSNNTTSNKNKKLGLSGRIKEPLKPGEGVTVNTQGSELRQEKRPHSQQWSCGSATDSSAKKHFTGMTVSGTVQEITSNTIYPRCSKDGHGRKLNTLDSAVGECPHVHCSARYQLADAIKGIAMTVLVKDDETVNEYNKVSLYRDDIKKIYGIFKKPFLIDQMDEKAIREEIESMLKENSPWFIFKTRYDDAKGKLFVVSKQIRLDTAKCAAVPGTSTQRTEFDTALLSGRDSSTWSGAPSFDPKDSQPIAASGPITAWTRSDTALLSGRDSSTWSGAPSFDPKDSQPIAASGPITAWTRSGKVMRFAQLSDHKLTERQTDYIWKALAPSVCLVTVEGVGRGTAFVVGKLSDDNSGVHHFLLTNHHLKLQDAFLNRRECQAHFGFKDLIPPPAVSVNIEPVVLAESPELDYVFLRLKPSIMLDRYLSSSVDLGNLITADRPMANDPLVIVGHPDCQELTFDPAVYCIPTPPNKDSKFIYYQCSSFHGSSGSPCFSITQQKLYCMHTGGTFHGPVKHVGRCSEWEYGGNLWEVVSDISRKVVAFRPGIRNKFTAHQFGMIFPKFKIQ